MDLVVGRVVKAHGIGGEVVVDVRTDDPYERFAPGSTLRARARDKTERRLVVASMREHSGRLLVRLHAGALGGQFRARRCVSLKTGRRVLRQALGAGRGENEESPPRQWRRAGIHQRGRQLLSSSVRRCFWTTFL